MNSHGRTSYIADMRPPPAKKNTIVFIRSPRPLLKLHPSKVTMKLRRLRPAPSLLTFPLLALLLSASPARRAAAQDTSPPDILTYIHTGSDTLSRSISDTKVDTSKSATNPERQSPILYLPAGAPTPPAVAAMQSKCAIQISH